MITCVIVGIIVSCLVDPSARPSPAQAAAILEQAPGLSNRTGIYAPSTEEQRRPRFVIASAAPSTVMSAPATRESDAARASRMGIPGGWTPLEWAILHGVQK